MLKMLIAWVVTTMAIMIVGCQSVTSGLEKINGALHSSSNQLATLNGKAGPGRNAIKNRWSVSDGQAMAWLKHDDSLWDNHGTLKGVDWYKFWAQQAHAKTPLYQRADKYCGTPVWAEQSPGHNCAVLFRAAGIVSSTEMRQQIQQSQQP